MSRAPEVSYRESASGVEPDDLRGFFEGWPKPPSPETLLRILRGSDHVVLAVERSSGAVVGFITALSDGVLSAYVPLLEVLPAAWSIPRSTAAKTLSLRSFEYALMGRVSHRLNAHATRCERARAPCSWRGFRGSPKEILLANSLGSS